MALPVVLVAVVADWVLVNMKDIVKIVAFFIVIGGFLSLSVACEVAKWRECRRYHPVWYCLDGSGKR